MKILNSKSKIPHLSGLKGERGFTLIEVLIAIALTGIIATGIVMAIQTSTKVLIITNTQETAKDIAANDMEYIRGLPYADNYTLPAPPAEYSAYSASVTVTYLRMNEQRIDIIISLNGGIISFSGSNVTLTDYRVNY